MKPDLIKVLCCPVCKHELDSHTFSTDGEEIRDGLLVCQDCSSAYPIHKGIPRLMVAPAYRSQEFLFQYGDELKRCANSLLYSELIPDHPDAMAELKWATAQSFGFEWAEFSKWGWVAAKNDETNGQRRKIEYCKFLRKALAEREEFDGKLVLDAGCGNGRYLYQAARLGREVIGVDISKAVDVAYQNMRKHPRVHLVQADLLNLPFRAACFDRIFSIGVLMHTGDAQGSFHELVRCLKPNGVVSIHVYRKGNAIYEWLDKQIRSYTTEMDHRTLLQFAKIIQVLPKAIYATRHLTAGEPILYSLLNCFVRLEFGHHYIFDWYSAPAASHHTYEEVFGWFRDRTLKISDHRNRRKTLFRRLLKSPAAGVTVKGGLQPISSLKERGNSPYVFRNATRQIFN